MERHAVAAGGSASRRVRSFLFWAKSGRVFVYLLRCMRAVGLEVKEV